MARRVPGPPAEQIWTFIPVAFDNRADKEPIQIDILQPTEAERRDLILNSESTPGGWRERALVLFVKGVCRYTASNGKAIENGADLWKHGETKIVSEAVSKIMGLDEEEKKISDEPSASNGTVPTAKQASEMRSGDAA